MTKQPYQTRLSYGELLGLHQRYTKEERAGGREKEMEWQRKKCLVLYVGRVWASS